MQEFKLNDFAAPGLKFTVWKVGNKREWVMQDHLHDCVEMMYVTQGAGICKVNGKPYPAARGDLFVITPEHTHAFSVERDIIYYNILFSPDLFTLSEMEALRHFPHFEHWITATDGIEQKYCFMPPLCDEIEDRIEVIADELQRHDTCFALSARAAFLQFIIYLSRCLKTMRTDGNVSTHESALAKVIHHINRHYQEVLTLEQLARKAGVSVSTLSRSFKKATGDSVMDYIGKIRAGKAQYELEKTSKSISTIAIELGYYDSSHFSKSFRRFIGVTPREFRRK